MPTTYDKVAGRSVERLAALSDGLFGVAMTLLLLDLHVPDHKAILTERDLLRAFAAMLPQILVYMLSFMTLGIFWVGQQSQLNALKKSDRHFTWIHLAFLFGVTIMPFSTRLLIDFITFRSALLAYWFTIFLLGLILYAGWGRAARGKLLKSDISHEVQAAVCRRIIFAQTLYALGAALCFINTYVSIAFILLVQLYYVLAPHLWFKEEIA